MVSIIILVTHVRTNTCPPTQMNIFVTFIHNKIITDGFFINNEIQNAYMNYEILSNFNVLYI